MPMYEVTIQFTLVVVAEDEDAAAEQALILADENKPVLDFGNVIEVEKYE